MRFNQLFYVVCLVVTCLVVWVFNVFRVHFSDSNELRAEAHYLRERIESEQSQAALLKYQVEDLRQDISLAISRGDKAKINDLLKVNRAPSSIPTMDLSQVLLEKGKKLVSQKKYDEALFAFRKILNDYPMSPQVVQAQFLTAEVQYLKKDYRRCLESIDKMVLQWPDHELTGFILLRMGQISEMNNKSEEASEIYRTIQVNFKNAELVEQAKSLDKNLRLE